MLPARPYDARSSGIHDPHTDKYSSHGSSSLIGIDRDLLLSRCVNNSLKLANLFIAKNFRLCNERRDGNLFLDKKEDLRKIEEKKETIDFLHDFMISFPVEFQL